MPAHLKRLQAQLVFLCWEAPSLTFLPTGQRTWEVMGGDLTDASLTLRQSRPPVPVLRAAAGEGARRLGLTPPQSTGSQTPSSPTAYVRGLHLLFLRAQIGEAPWLGRKGFCRPVGLCASLHWLLSPPTWAGRPWDGTFRKAAAGVEGWVCSSELTLRECLCPITLGRGHSRAFVSGTGPEAPQGKDEGPPWTAPIALLRAGTLPT